MSILMLMIACSITDLKDQMRVPKFCDSLYLQATYQETTKRAMDRIWEEKGPERKSRITGTLRKPLQSLEFVHVLYQVT